MHVRFVLHSPIQLVVKINGVSNKFTGRVEMSLFESESGSISDEGRMVMLRAGTCTFLLRAGTCSCTI